MDNFRVLYETQNSTANYKYI